jgi:putative DNA primase/helicase
MEKDVIDKEFSKALDEQSIRNCNQIATQIQEEHNLLFCDGFYYEYANGVFASIKEDIIKRIIKKKLGDKFTQNKANEILHSLRVDIALNDSEELNKSNLLNLKNGMFDLQILTLSVHSPEHKSTIQLPVNYNTEAKCDKWLKTLQEIFKDELEKTDVLQEFFGLCLTKEQKYEKALFLIGEGANGKSTILHILQQILGKKNYSSVPLELFNNQHYTANFYNRLANISIETNAKSSVYDSLMKAVITGDTISADFKYQNVIQFNPFCKLIFALNNMPRVDDKTDAFYRRLIIIRFNRQFDEEVQNKNLKYELEAELDGIFLWMLNGLKRLIERGYFERPEVIKKEIDEYRKENNNVLTFVEEECNLEPNSIISKRSLYIAYNEWCKRNGYRSLAIKKFGKELTKHFQNKIVESRDNAGDTKVWLGINTNIPVF